MTQDHGQNRFLFLYLSIASCLLLHFVSDIPLNILYVRTNSTAVVIFI